MLLPLHRSSSAGIQCPDGPSKTRGPWGESWRNCERMGQASARRPDHKIKEERQLENAENL